MLKWNVHVVVVELQFAVLSQWEVTAGSLILCEGN